MKRLRPGVAPTWNFPRQGLSSVRLLVESVSERLGAGGASFHPVVLSIRGTALDYQGDAGDDWRATTAYRPPAPRPATGPGTDADQRILRPGNVARPARLPIDLGGSPAILMSNPDWLIPDGANLVRVSGHEIDDPLTLTFIGRCRPDGTLGSGQDDGVAAVERDGRRRDRLVGDGGQRGAGGRAVRAAGAHAAAAGV